MTIKPVELTEDEQRAQREIATLQTAIDKLRETYTRTAERVITKDADGEFVTVGCPYCNSHDTRYTEDTTIDRDIEGFNDAGALNIDSSAEADYEGSDNGRVWCVDCGHNSKLPDDIEINWT